MRSWSGTLHWTVPGGEGGDVAQALDERRAAILRAIVQDYVRSGEPIGSKRLVEEWNLGVSSATVRSDMAALEDAGLITHPHTSAGRIPTDAGYRYFVDSMTGAEPVRPEQIAAMEGLLLGSRDVEELLRRTSSVLSRLTRFAALVVAPRLDRSRLRHVELVQLAPTSVLAVFIVDTGRVDKRMLDLATAVADHDVQRARHAINDAVANLRLVQVPDVIAGVAAGAPPEVRALVEAVADAVRRGLASAAGTEGDQVSVGGTDNMAAGGYFDRLEQVKSVFETLEEQVVVLRVLREVLQEDPAVRIG